MTALATAPTAHPRLARTWHAVLRLHRPALILWGVFVAAVSAVLLWAYGPGGNAASAAWQRKCTVDLCDVGYAVDIYHLAYRFSEAAIDFLPVLVALWAGSMLIGRELENGTAELAWSQSVSPARWLAAKLAVPAVLLTAGTILLGLLHRLLFDAHQVPKGWNWSDNRHLRGQRSDRRRLPAARPRPRRPRGPDRAPRRTRPDRRHPGHGERDHPHRPGGPAPRAVEDQRRRPEGGLRGTVRRLLRRRRSRHLHRRPHPRPLRRRRKGLPGRARHRRLLQRVPPLLPVLAAPAHPDRPDPRGRRAGHRRRLHPAAPPHP
ncbi:hypothetical protein ACRAWF_26440 [Streptomyces sp. L7]